MQLYNWGIDNGLKFNLSKITLLCTGKKLYYFKTKLYKIQIKLNNYNIQFCDVGISLEVLIVKDIMFQVYINKIVSISFVSNQSRNKT